MEHSGDLVNAIVRHTSRVAERYGALMAQAGGGSEDTAHLAAPPAPHPLDEPEADDE